MGGPGSGYGIKRPDHSRMSGGNKVLHGNLKNQKKHLKSVFSDLPDPSCHAHKLERDRRAGVKDYEMSVDRRKVAGLTYKKMQDIACEHAEEMMQVLLDVANDPDQPSSARVSAANSWLDRAFGKAATLNYNVNANADVKPSELSDAELSKRIDENLKVIEKQQSEAEVFRDSPSDLSKYN
jgi:hypothetical protein